MTFEKKFVKRIVTFLVVNFKDVDVLRLGSRMYLIPISRDHLLHQTDERCILVLPKMTQNYLFNPNFKIALLSYMHYI